MNNGASRREREREAHLSWVRRGVQQLTANLLRVVAGAGRLQDILPHLRALIEFVESYEKAVGHPPGDQEIADSLKISCDKTFIAKFGAAELMRADAIDTIISASLQIAASRLLAQKTPENLAETKLYNGIREMTSAQEQFRRERS